MDVKFLTYFLTLAAEKNMTKASEKLFVSQSSLSHFLSRLESEVGTPLFLRGRNELVLTPAGRLYEETAREVIHLRDRLYKNIASLENRGHIRLATSSQWGMKLISDAVLWFKDAFPQMTFEFRHLDLDQLYEMLSRNRLDFALAAIPTVESASGTTRILRKEELFFAVPSAHPYCRENPGVTITRQELTDRFCQATLLLSRKPTANRILADALFAEYRQVPTAVNDVNGIPVTKSMISRGIGCSFIPLSCKDDDKTIHYYSIDPPLYRYNALMQRDDLVLNEPERFFCSYVTNYFREPEETDGR